ncbi:MAG: hypothetical protein JNL79_37395 [Myxococcales bacterium]|nr:hypothetical protein [Myxococcales bacterium]
MLRLLTLLSVTITRAAIGGTLAFAVSLHWTLILPSALMDGLFGLGAGVRAIRGTRQEARWSLAELFVRLLIAVGPLRHHVDLWDWDQRDGWMVGRIATAMLWLAPIVVGRLAIEPVLAAWRGAQPDHRRRLLLALGIMTMVVPLCLACLLRPSSPWVPAVSVLGGVLVAVVLVRSKGLLRRQVRSLVRFASAAFVLTVGFDLACWHGTGFVPVYQRHGRERPRPRYVSEWRTIDWHFEEHPWATVGWQIDHGRFEPRAAVFARLGEWATADMLVINVPPGLCAPPNSVRRRDEYGRANTARSLDERAHIVEPVQRDGRLIYTFRDASGRLVQAEVSLDGRRAVCRKNSAAAKLSPPDSLVGARLLAAGDAATCAATPHLACWGHLDLDHRIPTVPRALPVLLGGAPAHVAVGQIVRTSDNVFEQCRGRKACRALVADTTVAILADGSLALSPPSSPLAPPLDYAPVGDIVGVALARGRACVLHQDHSLRCWGLDPPRLPTTDVRRVALGSQLACFQRESDGAVGCTTSNGVSLVEGLPAVTALDVGDTHACALAEDGGVWCWGDNHAGAIGDGTRIDRPRPTRILEAASAIALGAAHTCALGRDTKVRCWGRNTEGQLGDGTFVDRLTPTEVVW